MNYEKAVAGIKQIIVLYWSMIICPYTCVEKVLLYVVRHISLTVHVFFCENFCNNILPEVEIVYSQLLI